MILVHHHGNVQIAFDRGLDQVAQEDFPRVFSRTCRGLHDHRAVGFGRRVHDRLHLFQVVDVERGQTVAVHGGMVQQLAHGDECHG